MNNEMFDRIARYERNESIFAGIQRDLEYYKNLPEWSSQEATHAIELALDLEECRAELREDEEYFAEHPEEYANTMWAIIGMMCD